MSARKRKSKKQSDTRAGGKPPDEELTFFIDYCLGKHDVADALRGQGCRVELHGDHFKDNTEDVEWIAVVGAHGWIVLTKDKGIHRKPLEREAVVAASLRFFTLSGGNKTGSEMAEVFVRHLRRIERFARKHKPPFVALVSPESVSLSEGFENWLKQTKQCPRS